MKRVLVLNQFAAEPGSAGGTRHVEMFSRLVGWSYLIVVGNHAKPAETPTKSNKGYLSVPTVPYSGNGIDRIANWASFTASAVTRLWFGRKPNVIYASSPHLLTGLAGYILSKRWRVPFVLEVRDLWPKILVDMDQINESSPLYRSLAQLESFLYQHADRIVVMAQGTLEHLVNQGVPVDKLVFIPNSADPEDFAVSTARETLRSQYGFHRFTCVYTGAHGPANGLNFLLEAAAHLRDQDVDFVLVGWGPAKNSLMEKTRELGLDNVRFMDPVSKSEIPCLMAAADVGLHVLADVPLFRYGVSPNKVFDYLAAGLPMITNVPGEVSELVIESGGGLAVGPADIAIGVKELIRADPRKLSEMSVSGKKYMRANRSRTAMSHKLQLLLDEIVAS